MSDPFFYLLLFYYRLSSKSPPLGPTDLPLEDVAHDSRLPLLFPPLSSLPCGGAKSLSPRHISSLMTSWAKMRYRPHDNLLHHLVEAYTTTNSSTSSSPSSSSMFLHHARFLAGLVVLDHPVPSSSLEMFNRTLPPLLQSFTTTTTTHTPRSSLRVLQGVSTALWALTAMGKCEWEVVVELVMVAVGVLEGGGGGGGLCWPEEWKGRSHGADVKAALRKMRQVVMMLRLEGKDMGGQLQVNR